MKQAEKSNENKGRMSFQSSEEERPGIRTCIQHCRHVVHFQWNVGREVRLEWITKWKRKRIIECIG
jgi:hypothetical protein